MESREPKLGENTKAANIRTMKSDVSEFLKETKPSLIQLLTTQVDSSELPRRERPIKTAPAIYAIYALSVLAAIGAIGLGGYFGYRYFSKPAKDQATVVIPPPYFSVEKTISAPVNAQTSASSQIRKAVLNLDTKYLLTRMVLLTGEEGAARSITPQEFIQSSGIAMPFSIISSFTGAPMLLYYRTANGPRFAVVMKTNDPNRVLEQLLRVEDGLVQNWSPLFLNDTPPNSLVSSEDRTYRNISYRIIPLDPVRDIQLLYAIYPAKNYLIMSVSEEGFRLIINRLYESG